MITDEKELESTKKALEHAENALLALKKKVYPQNPQKYYLLSEPYLEYINRLRAEKDEYIGLASAEEQAMPLWIRLRGPQIQAGNVPIEILSKFLNNFKKGVQRVAEYVDRDIIRDSGRPHEDIRRLSNFKIKILPGSIRIGLSFPVNYKQETLSGELIDNPVEIAVNKLLTAASWSVGMEPSNIEKLFPNEQERYLLLNQIENYTPREGEDITSVEFNGVYLEQKTISLTAKSKIKIKEALNKTISPEKVAEEGVIREIDLDKQRFHLRERTDGKSEILCNYPEVLQEDAIIGLDNKVKILGELIKDKLGKPVNINVEQIDILGSHEE